MNKYLILKENIDFVSFNNIYGINKGTRKKYLVKDKFGNIAMFKYEKDGYICSESCSEKLSCEIAKVLGYECANIELALDKDGNLGVLNYIFLDNDSSHIDVISYLNVNNVDRSKFYKISNIKNKLDELDVSLFRFFCRMMVFDALIGEQDRHEENWGITIRNKSYKISPLYDNGCSLLREFRNQDFANLFYNNVKDFNSYINKSKTYIYKEDSNKRYKHFELIKYLKNLCEDDIRREIFNLNKLSNDVIDSLIERIPDDLLTEFHKKYIIMYLKKRRDILLEMIKEEG